MTWRRARPAARGRESRRSDIGLGSGMQARISAASDRDGQAVYVKVDRDNRGARRAVRRAVGPLLAERSPGTGLVTPLGFVASDQAAVWRGTAGSTMSQELRDPRRAAPLLALIGRAVRVLHDLDPHVVAPYQQRISGRSPTALGRS